MFNFLDSVWYAICMHDGGFDIYQPCLSLTMCNFLDYAGLNKSIEWSNSEMRYIRKAIYNYTFVKKCMHYLICSTISRIFKINNNYKNHKIKVYNYIYIIIKSLKIKVSRPQWGT